MNNSKTTSIHKSIDNMKGLSVKNTQNSVNLNKRYNEEFIDVLGELNKLLLKKGEVMRARAYQKAQESIINYPDDIHGTDQIKNLKGIGATIVKKLNEYIETGQIKALEKERNNPIHIFTEIYGIGPKKAQQLIDDGIDSLEKLKQNQDTLLNDKQKIGLLYYEDILKKIPREEIELYKKEIQDSFNAVNKGTSMFEIVGSYRRGAKSSGDIDIIITDSDNDKTIFKNFIDKLVEKQIIIQKLTDGKTKGISCSKNK